MLSTLFTAIICAIASSIFLAINPLSLGIIILALALTLAVSFSLFISSWLAFLIFLIYIRGMLVIFAYFVALVPNQQINIITIGSISIISTIIIVIFINWFNIKAPVLPLYISQIRIIYQKFNIPLLIILAWILLFTIVVVVKLVTGNKGPLRPF